MYMYNYVASSICVKHARVVLCMQWISWQTGSTSYAASCEYNPLLQWVKPSTVESLHSHCHICWISWDSAGYPSPSPVPVHQRTSVLTCFSESFTHLGIGVGYTALNSTRGKSSKGHYIQLKTVLHVCVHKQHTWKNLTSNSLLCTELVSLADGVGGGGRMSGDYCHSSVQL